MARTRGASSAFHQDSGIAFGKDGERLILNPHASPAPPPLPAAVTHMDDGELVVAEKSQSAVATQVENAFHHICDRTTVRRDIDAYELFLLLERVVGPLETAISPADFMRISPDLKRHFRRVPLPAPVES